MDNKKINKVINYNGNFKQSVICMEECAELTKVISKMLRGNDWYYTNLVEEMADVLISIEMLKQIYHVDESDLEGWVNFKVNRIGVDSEVFLTFEEFINYYSLAGCYSFY